MVWGTLECGGLGELVIFHWNKTITADSDYTILDDHIEVAFVKSATSISQQDGTPCHRACLLTNWFHDCQLKFI